MPRLTRSGGLVLTMALALAAAGRALRYPELVVIAATLAGATALAAVWAVAANRPVGLARVQGAQRVSEGEPATGAVLVTNPGGRRRSAVIVSDSVNGIAVAVAVPVIGAGETVTVELRLPGLPRGRYPLGPLAVDGHDPLGLVRTRRSIDDDATVLRVHPRVHPVALNDAHKGRRAGLQHRGMAPDAIELHHLDEYIRGDDSRLIHWPSSLRRGTLMVRHPARDNDEGDAVILLDTAPASYADDDEFEHGVRTAASVALAIAGERDATHLETTGGRRAPVDASPRRRVELLDELAAVRRRPGDAGLSAPARRADRPATTLVAVTGSGSAIGGPDGADLIEHLRTRAEAVTLLRIGPVTDAPGTGTGRGSAVTVIGAPTSDALVQAWTARVPA
jgi:uncharacterized protein (DUF58 family)